MACNNPSYSYCTDCDPGCDSCQGCNSCEKCNSGCQSTCLSKQTYDNKKISDFPEIGIFSFSLVPVKDAVQMGPQAGMFNQDIWDELSAWISKRNNLPIDELKEDSDECYNWVKEHNADGGNIVDSSNIADVAPFKAAEFNRVSSEVDGPTVRGAYSTPDADGIGDLITADLFTNLIIAANAKKVKSGACQHCNINCDLTCDVCQKCDASCDAICDGCEVDCNSCQACEGCDSCDICDSCDSCEVCNVNCNSGESSTEDEEDDSGGGGGGGLIEEDAHE